MDEIARLAIVVDSRGAVGASRDLDRFAQSSKGAEAAAVQMSARSSAAISAFASVVGKTAGVLAGAFASGQIYSSFRQVYSELARIADLSSRIGVTTRELQGLRYAVEKSGGTARDADAAYEGFAEAVGKAATGEGYLARLFAANGIQLRDQEGRLRSISALWEDFANLVQGAGSQAERLRIVTQVLGSAVGSDLVQALSGGADGLRAAADEGENLGRVLDDEVIDKAAQLDKAFGDLEKRATGAFQRIAVAIGGDFLDQLQLAVAGLSEFADILARIDRGDFSFLSMQKNAEIFLGSRMRAGIQGMTPEQSAAWDKAFGFQGGPLEIEIKKPPPGDTKIPPTRDPRQPRLDDFDRTTRSIEKQIEALEIQTKTFGMTERAAAEYEARQELINSVWRAGRENELPDLMNKIDDLAASYGLAAEKLDALQDRQDAIDGLSRSLYDTFSELTMGAGDFSDAIADLTKNLADMILQAALLGQGPFAGIFGTDNGTGGLFGTILGALIPNANGNAFYGGNVIPFARGGVIERPATFPMAGGQTGLMGEAGPEAIMPLRRLPNGRLGVEAGGGGSVSVPIDISIDARGADPAGLARVEQQLAQLRREVPGLAVKGIQNARLHGATV